MNLFKHSSKTIFLLLLIYITLNAQELSKKEYNTQVLFWQNHLDSLNIEILNTSAKNESLRLEISQVDKQIDSVWTQILELLSSYENNGVDRVRESLTDMSQTLDTFQEISSNDLYKNRNIIHGIYNDLNTYKSNRISAITGIQELINANEIKLAPIRARLLEIESKLNLEEPPKF
jgi:hypothetical protein